MEKIIKVPSIRLVTSLDDSYIRDATCLLSSIKFINKFPYRFNASSLSVEYTKIWFNNNDSLISPLSIQELSILIGEYMIILGANYYPLKNVCSFNFLNQDEWVIGFKKQSEYIGSQFQIFNKREIVSMTKEDIVAVWEREITNKVVIRNLKIASGGNI